MVIKGEDGPPAFRKLVAEGDFDVCLFVQVYNSSEYPNHPIFNNLLIFHRLFYQIGRYRDK